MPIVGQFGSLAGLGSLILPGGAFESIATVTGSASFYEFTNIPQTYQHLQIRGILRGSSASGGWATAAYLQLNTDTNLNSANYRYHQLTGSGTAAAAGSQQNSYSFDHTSGSNTANVFSAHVCDILDYASTSKTKVLRFFSGADINGSGSVILKSLLWADTSAITSIKISGDATYTGNWNQYSQLALYGIKAP